MIDLEYAVIRFWAIIHAFLDGLWQAMDKGHVVRRTAIFFTLWLTYHAGVLIHTIATGDMSGSDKAMVIGAIATPMAGLQAAMIGFYNSGRKHPEIQNDSKN